MMYLELQMKGLDRTGFAPIDYKMRFPALDGLRALAVTLVFLEHYAGGSHGGRVLRLVNAVRLRGWVGVDLFFVLSGFLITGILYDTRADSSYFKRFFARRSLRILPVFYLVTAVLLVLTPFAHYGWRWGHLLFPVYLGNLLGNYDSSIYVLESKVHPSFNVTLSHLWSLCVEEQFYVVWPVVVWLVRDRVKLLWTAAALCGVALALRCAMLAWAGPVMAERWIVRSLPFRMDALLAGGVLALLLRGPAAQLWQKRSGLAFALGSVGAGLIFVLCPAYDSAWLLTVGYSLVALGGAGLIGVAVRPGSIVFRIFTLQALRSLGKYSYGFYIFHLLFRAAWIQLLIFLGVRLHSVALAGIVTLSLNFAVTFAVAKLSWDLMESRFLRLKKYFAYDDERAGENAG